MRITLYAVVGLLLLIVAPLCYADLSAMFLSIRGVTSRFDIARNTGANFSFSADHFTATELTNAPTNSNYSAFTTLLRSDAKRFFEITIGTESSSCGQGIGVASSTEINGAYLGHGGSNSLGIYNDGSTSINNASVGNTGITFGPGDVIDIIDDPNAKTIQEVKNHGAPSAPLNIAALSTQNVSPAISLCATNDSMTYNGNPSGSYNGAVTWDAPVSPAAPPMISGVTAFPGNFSTPSTNPVETLTANCSAGSCAGATFSLPSGATAGCTAAQIAQNSLFTISGTNLNAVSTITGSPTENVGIVVTLSGVSDSGRCWPLMLTGGPASGGQYAVGAPPAPFPLATDVPPASGPFRDISPGTNQLSSACASATSGTIRLAAGTYTETAQCVLAPGVSIYGPNRDTTTVTSSYGGQVLGSFLISATSGSLTNGNQVITGFTIDGQTKNLSGGIDIEARNNVRIVNMAFTEIFGGAILVGNGLSNDEFIRPSVLVTGIQADHNNVTNTGYCDQSPGASCYGDISFGAMSGGSVHDNVVTDTDNGPTLYGGYGIKGVVGWFFGTKFYNNRVKATSSNPRWGTAIPVELWNVWDGTEVYNNTTNGEFSINHGAKESFSYSVRLHNNDIENPASDNFTTTGVEVATDDMEVDYNYFNMSSLNTFEMDSGESQNNIRIHHNVVRCGGAIAGICGGLWAFLYGGAPYTNMTLDNNTFWSDNIGSGNQTQWVRSQLSPGGSGALTWGLTVRNNIFMNTGTGGSGDNVMNCNLDNSNVNVSFDHNQFYNVTQGGTSCSASVLTFAGSQTGNPQLTLSGAVLSPFFLPLSGSPVINAGINIGYPFMGSAPNIGAVQSSATPPPPATFVANFSDVHQTIDGFGGSDAFRGDMYPANLDAYFCINATDPGCSGPGIGLSLLREGIDTTDNGVSSFVDTVPDPAPAGTVSSRTAAAGAKARGATLFATPWVVSDSNQASAAQGLANWASAQAAAGVPIYAMTTGNEVDCCSSFPFPPNDTANFVKILGPMLHGMSVKLISPEVEDPANFNSYVSAIEGDSAANAQVDIFSTHQYGCGITCMTVDGTRHVWENEAADFGGPWNPSIDDAMNLAMHWLYDSIVTVGLNGWNYWQLACGSGCGGAGLAGDFSAGTVMADNVPKRYYAVGNWSKFVRPGWVRVGVTGSASGIYPVAFKDPVSGKFAIVVLDYNGSGDSNVTFGIQNATISGNVTPYVTSGTPIGVIGTDGNLSAGSASSGVPSSLVPNAGVFTSTVPYGVTTFIGTAR